MFTSGKWQFCPPPNPTKLKVKNEKLNVERRKRESYKRNMLKMFFSWHVVWMSWASHFELVGNSM